LEVHRSLIAAILAGWIPVVAVLFRIVGARRATPISILGGYLVLPSEYLAWPLPGAIADVITTLINIKLIFSIKATP
jgi:hypothetical protein